MAGRNDAIAERFGRNLLRCRRLAALSQEELSERACLHRTEIGHLERGLRVPRIDTLVKLSGSLEAPADQLLDEITWVPGDPGRGAFWIGDHDG
jgi:transcriptional regulator with XRE-family HTH domain